MWEGWGGGEQRRGDGQAENHFNTTPDQPAPTLDAEVCVVQDTCPVGGVCIKKCLLQDSPVRAFREHEGLKASSSPGLLSASYRTSVLQEGHLSCKRDICPVRGTSVL